MTTNVYDGNAGMMATDSRWSVTYLNRMVYLDDVGFDKIERIPGHALMFAGLGKQVQAWKTWLRSTPKDLSGHPAYDGMSVTMARTEDKGVIFSRNAKYMQSGAIFAGTGWYAALACWMTNKDAQRSVNTAKKFDPFTGGETKFFDLVKGAHNLYPGADVGFTDVCRNFEKRGLIMPIDEKNAKLAPFPKRDSIEGAKDASNDEFLREVAAKIASGDLHPAAPCEEMLRPWTEEEKAQFNSALGDAFGWKK